MDKLLTSRPKRNAIAENDANIRQLHLDIYEALAQPQTIQELKLQERELWSIYAFERINEGRLYFVSHFVQKKKSHFLSCF